MGNASLINEGDGTIDKWQDGYVRHTLLWIGRTSRLLELDEPTMFELLGLSGRPLVPNEADEILNKVRSFLNAVVAHAKEKPKPHASEVFSWTVFDDYSELRKGVPAEAGASDVQS
ncbi:MAG: hypothetical protein J0I06_16980 [Planctomycetes bacterium]|nr:hypothetical protein [Planctomycetota bacterium]